jgi:DNA-directed RNA polymerase subunit alpha
MPLTGFLKPRIVDVQNLSPSHAKVTMEPFERGYGHTLGNALRRVLLSSMPGYAPTEVQIAGVVHEYSTLDGVREDVVDILLNLKGVVFRLHNRSEAILTLKKKGEGPVIASDIEPSHDVEIVNPEHVIAHLAAGGKVELQIKVEAGRGYVPGNMRYLPEETKGIGRVILDASFSPVRRVSYAVDSARVEQRTDLDKLILDIETNGAINPAEAVSSAGKTLRELLNLFADMGEGVGLELGEVQTESSGSPDLELPIEALDLSERPRNCLRRAQIKTVGELVQRTGDDLLNITNFGQKSLEEVAAKLDELGLSLADGGGA